MNQRTEAPAAAYPETIEAAPNPGATYDARIKARKQAERPALRFSRRFWDVGDEARTVGDLLVDALAEGEAPGGFISGAFRSLGREIRFVQWAIEHDEEGRPTDEQISMQLHTLALRATALAELCDRILAANKEEDVR